MNPDRAKLIRNALCTTTLIGWVFAGGCQSGGSTTSNDTPVTAMLADRGSAGGGGAVSQLDFFDALERRPTITWDELLAGVLLAAGKRADGAYTDRLKSAIHAGIVTQGILPEPTAQATPGDLAKVLLRAQGVRLRADLTNEEALVLAARRALVPEGLTTKDTLTGAIAVRALAAAGQPTTTPTRSTPAPATSTPKPPRGGSMP